MEKQDINELINKAKANNQKKNIYNLNLKSCQNRQSIECSLYRSLRFTQYIEFKNRTSPLSL